MAPTTRTDEQIQKDVLDELTWDARVRPNEIGVTVSDGVVALNRLGRLSHQEVGGRGGRSPRAWRAGRGK